MNNGTLSDATSDHRECLALIDGHSSLVGQVRLDPAANILVSAGSDGRIIVYDLIKAEIRHRIRAHDNSVTSVQFDNRFIISSGNDGQVKLWGTSFPYIILRKPVLTQIGRASCRERVS